MLNKRVMLSLIRANLVTCAHDCSKGGLAIALCEMAIGGKVGLEANLDLLPTTCSRLDYLLFSESQSRFLFATSDPMGVENLLKDFPGLIYARIGKSSIMRSSEKNRIVITKSGLPIITSFIAELEKNYNSLSRTMC